MAPQAELSLVVFTDMLLTHGAAPELGLLRLAAQEGELCVEAKQCAVSIRMPAPAKGVQVKKLVTKLPESWEEHQDDSGRTYYWNSVTGQSQWFPPPLAAKSAETVRSLIIQHNFKAADKDGSGTISKSELGLMLRRITPDMSLKEVEDMHKSMDKDMDGKVSFAEFNTWIMADKQKKLAERLTKNVSSPANAVSATFRIWDTDGSGKLTEAEVTSVLQKAIPHITNECLQAIFGELDSDRKPVCIVLLFLNRPVLGGRSTWAFP